VAHHADVITFVPSIATTDAVPAKYPNLAASRDTGPLSGSNDIVGPWTGFAKIAKQSIDFGRLEADGLEINMQV
jgi:hypothetical protein